MLLLSVVVVVPCSDVDPELIVKPALPVINPENVPVVLLSVVVVVPCNDVAPELIVRPL